MASKESSVEIGEFSSSPEHEKSSGKPDEEPSMETDGRASGSWADECSDTGVPVPDALQRLINNGVRFKSTAVWSQTARPMLVKSLSVYFSVDTVVTSQEILEAFDAANIDVDFIASIQRRSSNRTWVVSFTDQLAKETALEVASIEIAGSTVFLGDCENRLVLVKIYEAPLELPDTVVIGRLNHYGRVLSFRRDKIAKFIENGVRTARMSLSRHIPSIVNLAGECVRIWYPNQPKTCRNCGAEDHLVKECKSVWCFNCEKSGHRLENCEESPKCTACKSEEHRLAECPYVLYSANVDSGTQQELSEEEKQKEKEKYREVELAKKKQQEADKQQARLKESVKKTASEPTKDMDNGRDKEDKGSGKNNGKDNRSGKDKDNGRDNGDDNGKQRGEKRSRSDDDRRQNRSGDEREEKEKRDRRDYEAWKEQRRRDRDRADRHERDYSHRDRRDRSSRRDRYYTDDEDDDDQGWTEVSYRRGRRRDY